MKPALAVLVLVACKSSAPSEPPPITVPHATLAFTNIRVFDGEQVLAKADVLIDGDKIVAVAPRIKIPAGVEVVDGAGKTLLPGLFDAHAHVFDAKQLEQSLAFGVTTVLDMFSVPDLVKKMKADDKPDRAQLLSAGILATPPGGHGTEYGFEIPTIVKPEDAQGFVDARFAEGSDYLKIVFDDGSDFALELPTVSPETLKALIAAAHTRGKLAVVHIGDYEEARTAIDSGADGLVHLFRDIAPAKDFGTFVATKKAFVTPTLAVLRSVHHEPTMIGDDPTIAPYLGPDAKATLGEKFPFKAKKKTAGAENVAIAQLRDAKVPILAGTDAPNAGTTFGATVHDELALLVEAGLPPVTALAGATALPALRFGLPDRGRIAVGLRADLIMLDGDPTTTITDTRKIVGIWRGGTKFDRAAYRARIAEANRVAALPVTIGPISDFEDGTTATRFGQAWAVSSDTMIGGTSKAALTVVDAANSKHAMQIAGEVVAGTATWAGAMFSPGQREFAPVDLSTKQLAFLAKGDGKPHVVMVFSQKRGRIPAVRTFKTGKDFAPVTFTWKDFDGLDGTDILGIFIGHTEPGAFTLVVDDVELR